MDQSLSLVTLGVRDVAHAADFYERAGFERRHDLGDIVFLPTTGPVLALYGWDALAEDAGVAPAGEGFRGVTLAVNLDSAEEVDTAFDAWLAAGATSVRAPVAKEWGGYSGYLADPDGHLWEIAFNPSQALMRINAQGRLELVRPAD
ncbi:VOC family protein [Nocardiopsis valliformis]|uniref:VOC family protein n=1 Tax=Nocardiopsis valliformis TaxID=239974 RepID=UPI0003459F90|nr:VOC family protein [Nocardiopsis valliformis]